MTSTPPQTAIYTEWYQRTDEDGRNVDYDFETGKWSDGYDPEDKEK